MMADAVTGAGEGRGQRDLLTLAQAEEIGPYSRAEIRRAIRDRKLLEGVHYVCPHRSLPLLVRDAYLAFLHGDDSAFRKQAPSRRRQGRANFDLVGGL